MGLPLQCIAGQAIMPDPVNASFRRNQTRKTRGNKVLPWVFPGWWLLRHGGGYREGVVIRHNGLTELDLTVTYRWTF
jgi:hypothetical protein